MHELCFTLRHVIPSSRAVMLVTLCIISEIYKIVSQKQIHDTPDDDSSPSNNVQTIHVGPTDSFADRRKQCCNP